MQIQGGDKTPWIETDGSKALWIYDSKSVISRMWNMETGEEYVKEMSEWYSPASDHPYRIGIEWTPGTNDISSLFSNQNIIAVSAGLLSPIIDTLVTVELLFSGSTLVTVPDNLFLGGNRTQLNFTRCFNGCSYLTGHTPLVDGQELWEYYQGVQSDRCFFGCSGLENYDEIPAGWK